MKNILILTLAITFSFGGPMFYPSSTSNTGSASTTVIDDLNSTSKTSALSANKGKVLQDTKQDILAEGRFVDGDKAKLDTIFEEALVTGIAPTGTGAGLTTVVPLPSGWTAQNSMIIAASVDIDGYTITIVPQNYFSAAYHYGVYLDNTNLVLWIKDGSASTAIIGRPFKVIIKRVN